MIGICTVCRSLMDLTRHHIVPRSKGGADEDSNIQLACRPCHDELDKLAGVRPEKHPDWRKKRNKAGRERRKRKRIADKAKSEKRCVKCGNSIPKRIQLGVMLAREVQRENLCQRHAWERERELWHSVRESLARKKLPMAETDDNRMSEMLRRANC